MRRYYTGKSQCNLYLLDEARQSLKDKGYNLSEVINDYLIQLDLEESDEIVMKRKIDSIDGEIEIVEKEIEIRYHLIDELRVKKQEMLEEYEKNRKTAYLNKYIRRLNDIIVTWRYDEDVVREKGSEIIEQICSVDGNFNLTKHIELFKKLMKR